MHAHTTSRPPLCASMRSEKLAAYTNKSTVPQVQSTVGRAQVHSTGPQHMPQNQITTHVPLGAHRNLTSWAVASRSGRRSDASTSRAHNRYPVQEEQRKTLSSEQCNRLRGSHASPTASPRRCIACNRRRRKADALIDRLTIQWSRKQCL